MNIGDRIKNRRKELGISAEQLAEAINVSPATIYRYESGGIENMGVDKLTPIAQVLCTNEAFLMGWAEDSSPFAMRQPYVEHSLTPTEEILIAKFRELNDEGKEKLIDQANLLITGGYIKNDPDRMVD